MIEEIEPKIELTKSGNLRKRKPKTSNYYFTQETEDAILEYLSTDDEIKRNIIYNKKISYSFYKLVENIIHTFKFYYMDNEDIEDLKHELIVFLLEKLHLYNQKKGKAYSYFGTITKRYLINYNKKNYQKLQSHTALSNVDDDHTIFVNLLNEHEKYDHSAEKFLPMYIEYIDKNLKKIFTKHDELLIADSILMLFNNKNSISILNKKSIYLYLKEINPAHTRHITKIIGKFKEIYIQLYKEYDNNGYIKI